MKCPKCHFENREEAKFCKRCGSPLEQLCPSCGHACEADSVFCDECGHLLRTAEQAASIDYSVPQTYTPQFLAQEILNNRSVLEGERKLVTVFFADVANYTAVAERLDPEEVHQIMDGCFRILMEEIHRFEGNINQFTGDGIMALFGAPIAHEDHAQRACHAALSVQQAMRDYGEDLKRGRGIQFRLRVGINTGQVFVGSIGDDLRMDYTAIGDTTNLASRMESMARAGSILVSENTHKLARDFFEFKSIGKVEVKGKADFQEAFELVKPSAVVTRIEASVARGLSRFVGRKHSMAALMEAYERVREGSGQIVGVIGEAGVGKSRLVLEFKKQLPLGDVTYLEGRCLHYGSAMPYLPMLDMLRSYFQIEGEDREPIIKKKLREKAAEIGTGLEGAVPVFQELLSVKVDDEAYLALEPQQRRERIFEGLRDLLVQESQGKTVVAVIDDLHWIDRTSEAFLDYLIGWLANTRILMILLFRSEYTHQWGGKSYYNRIGLGQLSSESSARLVQAILGTEIGPELKELILSRGAGNPLFMEELTHSLLEDGSIERRGERYVLTRRPSDILVPDTVQGLIAARMDRLEDSLKRIMQVASVIGREFAFRILQSITAMREELKSYLLNLQGLELIYEKRLFPELEYIFKHALTQQVAYSSLLLRTRSKPMKG